MKVAVIGTGVAGISVLRELAKFKKMYSNFEITVFGDEKTFGTGLPYQPDSEVLLLNQTPETMSIVPEKPYHFVEWLKKTLHGRDLLEKIFQEKFMENI